MAWQHIARHGAGAGAIAGARRGQRALAWAAAPWAAVYLGRARRRGGGEMDDKRQTEEHP
jgi:hypothetical protein